MEYTVGDNVIVYDIYSSPSECKEDIDPIFSVGKATKVVYVKDVQLNIGTIADLIAALKEFCQSLKNQCILFSLDTTARTMASRSAAPVLKTIPSLPSLFSFYFFMIPTDCFVLCTFTILPSYHIILFLLQYDISYNIFLSIVFTNLLS